MRPLDWQKGFVVLVILGLAAGGVFYLWALEQTMTTLYAPKVDLPAYHLITATDLMTTTLSTASLSSSFLRQEAELAGRYTRQPLTAQRPVTEAQLVPRVDEKYVADTTAVAIPATAAMTYNSQLTPGAVVAVWAVTDTGKAEPLLAEALVLDVQKVEAQREGEDNLWPYIIILAVPSPKQAELITVVASGSLILTLTP
jgi:Flp pilus assembly protein CpaB